MLPAIRPLLDDLKPQRHSSRVFYVFGGFWIGLITVQAWRGEASHFNVFEETMRRSSR